MDWDELAPGARVALEEQWTALAAGGLPCGAAVVDGSGRVRAHGRNRAYDDPDRSDPLEFTPIAHAELNALAGVITGTAMGKWTVWSTQHPCSMCAAAIAFTGVGAVRYLADDPSDDSTAEVRNATRGPVDYQRPDVPFWSTAANLIFLYSGAVRNGDRDGNLAGRRADWPELTALVLELAADDLLGNAAREGVPVQLALGRHTDRIKAVAAESTRP